MASALVRGMATSVAESAIKHVTIIGGGLMGSGIAQVSFTTQIHVLHRSYQANILLY